MLPMLNFTKSPHTPTHTSTKLSFLASVKMVLWDSQRERPYFANCKAGNWLWVKPKFPSGHPACSSVDCVLQGFLHFLKAVRKARFPYEVTGMDVSDCPMRSTNYATAVKLLNSFLYRSASFFHRVHKGGSQNLDATEGWAFPTTTRSLWVPHFPAHCPQWVKGSGWTALLHTTVFCLKCHLCQEQQSPDCLGTQLATSNTLFVHYFKLWPTEACSC